MCGSSGWIDGIDFGAESVRHFTGLGFFSYWYVKYDRIIEQRFRDPVFTNSAKIYAGPRMVRVGSAFTVREIAADLRHAGYGEKDGDSLLGSYHAHGGSIEVLPGPEEISRLTNWSRNLSPRCLTQSSVPNARW